MRIVFGALLIVLGIVTLPMPNRLAVSPAAWIFGAISAASFVSAYFLLRTKRSPAIATLDAESQE